MPSRSIWDRCLILLGMWVHKGNGKCHFFRHMKRNESREYLRRRRLLPQQTTQEVDKVRTSANFSMKYLAIFVPFVAVVVGAIVYNVYYPLSLVPTKEASTLSAATYPSRFDLACVVEKLGIAPREKFLQALELLSDFPKWKYSIEDTIISGVAVRIYRPKTGSESSQDQMRPALIYFHGGGLVVGSAKSGSNNEICSAFAERTKSIVISVEYRLAPEHKFPAGFQDCYAVVTAVIKEAKRFGIIKDKIAMGGDSAGGLLTAAVSLQLIKENRLKDIATQLLIYPWLQLIDITCLSSYQKYGDKFGMSRRMMAFFCSCVASGKRDFEPLFLSGNVSRYFMDTPYWDLLEIPKGSKCNIPAKIPASIPPEITKVVVDPRLSPLLADSVEGSPPTFMLTAEYDPMANEGDLYARRLEKAGVPVIQKKYKAGHGFIHNIADPIAVDAMENMINHLNSTFYET